MSRTKHLLLTGLVAFGGALPALAQDYPQPDIPLPRITSRRIESLARDSMIRRVSGVTSVSLLDEWVGTGDRYDDSTMVLLSAWMRDLFAHLSPSACMNAAVDFGPSFPLREVDSALAERYADIVITARVLARVRDLPLRQDRGSDSALLAALLSPTGPSAIADTQRVRRAFEHRSPSEEEYCWFTRVAWARLAALPAQQTATLARRMYDRMTQ